MTVFEIATIGKEFTDNYYNKYHQYIIKTYKYRGEIRTRKISEMTKEGEALLMGETLNTPAFTCPWCHKKVSFNDLEVWDEDTVEDIANNKVPCAECYEEEMGEDL